MLGGGGTITLFHVRGIRIAVDWSWFFVLFLVIFWLSQFYGDVLGESSSSTTPFVLALLSAVGFFGSIVLHELGHAFVAMRNGIGITQHPALDLRRGGTDGPRVRQPRGPSSRWRSPGRR